MDGGKITIRQTCSVLIYDVCLTLYKFTEKFRDVFELTVAGVSQHQMDCKQPSIELLTKAATFTFRILFVRSVHNTTFDFEKKQTILSLVTVHG